MRKLFIVALLSMAAFAVSVSPATAGWFCRSCGRLGACATQYNAFSPYCVTGVYTSHHCHRCTHPAEGPCNGNAGLTCDGGGCVGCAGPAITAGMGTAILGELPAPVMTGAIPSNQTMVPRAPMPVPSVPGAVPPYVMPAQTVQSLR
jgi:hypothetical protein